MVAKNVIGASRNKKLHEKKGKKNILPHARTSQIRGVLNFG